MAESSTSVKKGEIRNPKGRGKGVRDKIWAVLEACERLGHDPIEAMIITAKEDPDPKLRLLANTKLLERMVPALKSIEHISNDLNPSDMQSMELLLKKAIEHFKSEY